MPVFSRRFLDKSTGEPAPDHLRLVGARLSVEIGVPDVLAAHLAQVGKPIPSPKSGYALVDTGASATAVDQAVLQELGLNPIGSAKVSVPSGTEDLPLFPAKLSFPASPMPELNFTAVIGANLQNQGYIALIGRDVLIHMVFIFNGPGAHVTFAF